MHEAEHALKRWKEIYDRLVQADRKLLSCRADDEARTAIKAEIVRLTHESDAALAELNRCVALLAGKGKGPTS